MCSFYSENICSDFTQLSSNLKHLPELELVEGVCNPGDVVDLKKQVIAVAISYSKAYLLSGTPCAISFGNLYRWPSNSNKIAIDGTRITFTYAGGVAAGGVTGDTDPADYYAALVVK